MRPLGNRFCTSNRTGKQISPNTIRAANGRRSMAINIDMD